jgi:hypothetical protein
MSLFTLSTQAQQELLPEQMDEIDISPDVSMLGVLPHLKYTAWHALAEYVDNSLQNFLNNEKALREVGCKKVVVKINIDGNKLTIRDNAAGIAAKDYARAFRTAEIPLNNKGLHEFGMGMKSASCWFAHVWSVRTSALGEAIERSIEFDVDQIVATRTNKLSTSLSLASSDAHYTEVTLMPLRSILQSSTHAKIKRHLPDIYRDFIRQGKLEIQFNSETLNYTPPKVLSAPFFKTPDAKPLLWSKHGTITHNGISAQVTASLRGEEGGYADAGFALFRRGRVIKGSGDEQFRPYTIFGTGGSFISLRLFGEIHLEGVGVTHTKDELIWNGHEDSFLEELKTWLDEGEICLLSQAKGHRSNPKPAIVQQAAQAAASNTANAVVTSASTVIDEIITESNADDINQQGGSATVELYNRITEFVKEEREIYFNKEKWNIAIELSMDPSVGHWVEVDDESYSSDKRRLNVRLSLCHPFMVQFCKMKKEDIEPFLRIAVAIALAEKAAYDCGVADASVIRHNINRLLKDTFSNP